MTAKVEEVAATGLAHLLVPFEAHQIAKLPRALRKGDQEKGECVPGSTGVSFDGVFCGGWHALSKHLDYVGHAELTRRLLEADPEWTWEPMALDQYGLPLYDMNDGLWIKLTVCGVTRLGYGDADGKTGGNAVKEAIGDALRNAGMRFGAALDLWAKGDKYALADGEQPAEPKKTPRKAATPKQKPVATSELAEFDWISAASQMKDQQQLRQLIAEIESAGAMNQRVVEGGPIIKEELNRIWKTLPEVKWADPPKSEDSEWTQPPDEPMALAGDKDD